MFFPKKQLCREDSPIFPGISTWMANQLPVAVTTGNPKGHNTNRSLDFSGLHAGVSYQSN